MHFFPHGRVFLDHGSGTPVDPSVVRVIREAYEEYPGNPIAVHSEGRRAKEALESARKTIALCCGVKKEHVIFTGSATEANNLAILGIARHALQEGKKAHIVTSTIEHISTLAVCEELFREGAKVTYVPTTSSGLLDPKAVADACTKETTLCTFGLVNSEIGVIQPIRKIREMLMGGSCRPLIHIDAAQAPEYLSVHIHTYGADLMTLDAQKVYGPKGIGALIMSSPVPITPVLYGAGQERGLRPGTENVPLALGFARALKIAEEGRREEKERVQRLREMLQNLLLEAAPNIRFNGSLKERVPNNLSLSIPSLNHSYLAVILDARGVSVATGSACTTEGERSHVLEALGNPDGALRVTLGRDTQERDIKAFVRVLTAVLADFDRI